MTSSEPGSGLSVLRHTIYAAKSIKNDHFSKGIPGVEVAGQTIVQYSPHDVVTLAGVDIVPVFC
jgi:hypothetical protein